MTAASNVDSSEMRGYDGILHIFGEETMHLVHAAILRPVGKEGEIYKLGTIHVGHQFTPRY